MHTRHPAFENYLFIVFCSFNANSVFVLCLKPYPEDPAVYKPLSQEELQRIKNEKKQKQNERKQKISENRKHSVSAPSRPRGKLSSLFFLNLAFFLFVYLEIIAGPARWQDLPENSKT